MTGEFVAVPGWEGLYEVSSDGEVRSIPRRVTQRDGKTITPRAGLLKPRKRKRSAYLRVMLQSCGRGRHAFIHNLVLEAFVGPRPEGMQARHLNGNAADNRLENLAWGTLEENMRDREMHNPGTFLSAEERAHIRALHREGWLGVEIARKFDVAKSTICRVIHAAPEQPSEPTRRVT